MTVIEWLKLGVLVVSLVLSITVSIVVLVKGVREGFARRRAASLVLALGLLFVAYLAYNIQEIHPAEMLQVMLMAGLIAVTGVYALFTARQAEASVKMAEEMREQRYDAILPVIEIETRRTELERAGVNVNILNKREGFPDKLTCILRNIGVGPAIDVYSFVQTGTQPDDERPAFAFGTLAKGGETGEMPLSLKPRGDRKVLVAYYRDVYGRYFESSREVNGLDWKLGPLNPRKITKEALLK